MCQHRTNREGQEQGRDQQAPYAGCLAKIITHNESHDILN